MVITIWVQNLHFSWFGGPRLVFLSDGPEGAKSPVKACGQAVAEDLKTEENSLKNRRILFPSGFKYRVTKIKVNPKDFLEPGFLHFIGCPIKNQTQVPENASESKQIYT